MFVYSYICGCVGLYMYANKSRVTTTVYQSVRLLISYTPNSGGLFMSSSPCFLQKCFPKCHLLL